MQKMGLVHVYLHEWSIFTRFSCRYIYHRPIEVLGVEFVKHKKILQNNGLPTEEETFGIH